MICDRKVVWLATVSDLSSRLERIAAKRIRLTTQLIIRSRRLSPTEVAELEKQIAALDAEKDSILQKYRKDVTND